MASSGHRMHSQQAQNHEELARQRRVEEEARVAAEAQLGHRLEEVAKEASALREAIGALRGEIIEYGLRQYREKAGRIVDRIRGLLHRSPDAADFQELRALDVPTADIERNCEQFRHQLLKDPFEGRHPCFRNEDGHAVPLAHNLFATPLEQKIGETAEFVSSEEAVDGFTSELTPFLAQRVVGDAFVRSSMLVGGFGGTPHMLTIRVTSRTPGARVEYSPAYFISYAVLSAPTSPVKGAILPGRYIFMISVLGSSSFDKGVFDIPPHFDVDLNI